MNRKLLLTAVFGPYGIKNRYAEGIGMQMELLNNQITRQQGIHSPRQNYWTFALYLLAENVSVPAGDCGDDVSESARKRKSESARECPRDGGLSIMGGSAPGTGA